MNQIPETPGCGVFALVSYIPDPLGSFLHELRQALPGEDNPRPHITILPPRPLQIPVEAASKQARRILRQFRAFEVELSTVRCFSETRFLYLDVGRGNDVLHDLHETLNTRDLAYDERFAFRPHLTLGGPVNEENLRAAEEHAEAAWRSFVHPRGFELREVAGLWLKPGSTQREWDRLWSHTLKTREATAMGLAAAVAVTSQTS